MTQADEMAGIINLDEDCYYDGIIKRALLTANSGQLDAFMPGATYRVISKIVRPRCATFIFYVDFPDGSSLSFGGSLESDEQ